jgi:GNAT superfamily N-acetyltransferase
MPVKPALTLEYRPVTAEWWRDLEQLFGERGAYSGCWCMWWRLTRAEFARQGSQGRKAGLKAIVDAGEVPGLLAYARGEPIAWCAVAPREAYPALERSRTLKRVDATPVWSVTCFFVAQPFRRQGLMVRSLQAAIAYAAEHGARMVEGYPVDPGDSSLAGCSGYTGLVSAFRQAGFVEVLQRAPNQPIMRYAIEGREANDHVG